MRGERILVVTNNYPTRARPNVGTFVANLVETWVGMGVPVVVIAPRPYFSATTGAVEMGDGALEGEHAQVLRPGFTSFSALTLRPGLSTARWSLASLIRTVRKTALRASFQPTHVYAHFLFPAGAAALALRDALDAPVVAALGEADFGEWEHWVGRDRARETANRFDALLAVSEENARYCVEAYGIARERIGVFPNGVDLVRFQPRDRDAMRKQLGLPQDRPIVAFTGNFSARKGPLRVVEALAGLPEVAAIFLGEGAQRPRGDQVLFAGRVANEEVANYLAAADLYVLPTRAEGSPNSVLEAMACGLPIVSSRIPALEETVPEEGAVLVDPDDVGALRAAIADLLADDERRARMREAVLARARERSIDDRATDILDWLSQVSRA